MADVTDAQQKRAEARKRRRKQDEPERESEPESSPQAGADGHDAGQGARQAAKLAAAIGAAGAAAAVAKALTSHGDEQKDEQDVEAPAPDDRPVAKETEETEQPQDADETYEPQDAAGPEPQEEPERDERPVQGAGAGDARRAIDRGREQLEDLLGRPVEKVSSLERTHDGWVLALEVVELQRIPETTDVLATYEMELDGDLNLRRYEQARRYHRGHTDNGDER